MSKLTESAQAEQAESIILQCPKCLEVQERGEVCVRCGLIFKKYHDAESLKNNDTCADADYVMFNLGFIGKDVKDYLDKNRIEKSNWSKKNLSEFADHSNYAISLIFKENEILLFSILQWVTIGIAYYIWVQMLGWIPNEVWESQSKLHNLPLNLALLGWSFICVALAAYPISILTGAMGAAHFFRQQGHPSTIATCLALALSNSKKLWMFHTADGWFTVDMILERLPKKGGSSGFEEKAIKEVLYYAWKLGTICVPAALLTGKGLIEAGKESISLVKNKFGDVLGLRGGYSMFCWIVGIAAYLGANLFFVKYNGLFQAEHKIFTFYLWMGVPILIAVGVINLFVRPIFVIASCKLYSDHLKEVGKTVELASLPGKGISASIAFFLLCTLLLTIFLYREELGLMNILRVLG